MRSKRTWLNVPRIDRRIAAVAVQIEAAEGVVAPVAVQVSALRIARGLVRPVVRGQEAAQPVVLVHVRHPGRAVALVLNLCRRAGVGSGCSGR